MKEEIIIEVDNLHRIKITKYWSGVRNEWMWEVRKQRYFRLFSLFKNWHTSDWGNSQDFFIKITSYNKKETAINEAESIKRCFLKNN